MSPEQMELRAKALEAQLLAWSPVIEAARVLVQLHPDAPQKMKADYQRLVNAVQAMLASTKIGVRR